MPKIEEPKVEMPKVEMPAIEIPKVSMPKIEMSMVNMPEIGMLKFDGPKTDPSKSKMSVIRTPESQRQTSHPSCPNYRNSNSLKLFCPCQLSCNVRTRARSDCKPFYPMYTLWTYKEHRSPP
jgi:hypothetical protein